VPLAKSARPTIIPRGVDDLRVVRRGERDYETSRSPENANSAHRSNPAVVVFCDDEQDIVAALSLAEEEKLRVACRAGAHSYAGFSGINDGMVLDLRALNNITIDEATGRVNVGAGTSFQELMEKLQAVGLHVPPGLAPSVCVGGFVQGGGYSFSSREFGMNCDAVVAARVVTADGQVHVVNAQQEPDLFWAIRGGTGNNFGVLTEVTYQAVRMGQVWGFRVEWPIEDAVDVFTMIEEHYTLTAPRQLGYLVGLISRPDAGPDNDAERTPVVLMMGTFNGSAAAGRAALGQLLSVGHPLPFREMTGPYYDVAGSVLSDPYQIPTLPEKPVPSEEVYSAFVSRPVSREQWARIVALFRRAPSPGNYVCIEPYGGAIARPATESAYEHRNAAMNVFTASFWRQGQVPGAAQLWTDDFIRISEEIGNGEGYQNYPNPRDGFFATRYWPNATSRARLSRVKQAYDPQGRFQFPQGVPLPPPAPPSGES
jgi:FAD/FMN-containing dehydrogenase